MRSITAYSAITSEVITQLLMLERSSECKINSDLYSGLYFTIAEVLHSIRRLNAVLVHVYNNILAASGSLKLFCCLIFLNFPPTGCLLNFQRNLQFSPFCNKTLDILRSLAFGFSSFFSVFFSALLLSFSSALCSCFSHARVCHLCYSFPKHSIFLFAFQLCERSAFSRPCVSEPRRLLALECRKFLQFFML